MTSGTNGLAPVGCRRGPWPGAAMIGLGLVISACTGAGGAEGKTAVEDQGAAEFHQTDFDPANFVDPTESTNPWHPLRPGMQWVRVGTTEVGSRAVPHQVISTMTDVIREIDGVPTILLVDEDTDSGEIAQLSLDYLALDKDGNVWLMGGYTEEYSGGEYTNVGDAWLGTADGFEPGILMPADPQTSTPPWVITLEDEREGTAAEVVEVGASECVKFACYEDVLVVREGEIGALDNEFKFYAQDVGQILNSPRKDSRHKDVEELINLTELSPDGLAEVSDQALSLEKHARETSPDVYGEVPEATRVP